eukprot:Amastigsp_a841320_358.p3 type:complete len:109 gc:universal Amastigsp_a841320_358:374-48(-)
MSLCTKTFRFFCARLRILFTGGSPFMPLSRRTMSSLRSTLPTRRSQSGSLSASTPKTRSSTKPRQCSVSSTSTTFASSRRRSTSCLSLCKTSLLTQSSTADSARSAAK